MSLPYVLDDYDLDAFVSIARSFVPDRYGYVVTPNVDHFIRYHDDPAFRARYADADFILLDSRFLSHLFGVVKSRRIGVCTGSDLTAQLFERVIEPNDQIVLIGGSDHQARILAERYQLNSIKHYNPPMNFVRNPAEVEACVEFVEAHSPFRYCFLAVGAPQQELLAQLLKSRGKARGMALCIGASIDFLTGKETRAPVWMQKIGFEWLFRLLSNPKRLGRRYLLRGPRVFSLLWVTKLRVRPRPIVHAAPALTTTVSLEVGG
ncbi:MAG TPA: WecB/TagA/CpsF family glycosyltransferase [Steroidobacteraceae bacterium]|nr:WecB/TagA/CpsF family glycosyltransferase [Steroidobacteraceae bacterium]